MENNENQDVSPISLCSRGCGFFGSPSFDGMCSKCFKDVMKRKQASPASSGRTSPTQQVGVQPQAAPSDQKQTGTASAEQGLQSMDARLPSVNLNATVLDDVKMAEDSDDSSSTTSSGQASGASEKTEEKKRNRCTSCKKKVGLTGFQCRCGGLYCSVHRYSDMHSCTFDYKEHGAELIRKHNPVIVGEKLQKI